jgi:alpha-1,2-glucosyltransferase
MLYIWPYFTFFSLPILVPSAITPAMKSGKLSLAAVRSNIPRLWVLAIFLIISSIVVQFNTIIHPFTLADNRHYVFYVFKILRGSWLFKHLAIPFYIGCGSLVIDALHQPESRSSLTITRSTKRTDPNLNKLEDGDYRIGFSIVWLATSTLCLVTAPLVEPRYFIVPWVIWRLQVGTQVQRRRTKEAPKRSPKDANPKQKVWAIIVQPRTWLWLETLWFLLINAITCYLFLQKTFEWPQEPGRKQRFMW